jgi:hypothetical protein
MIVFSSGVNPAAPHDHHDDVVDRIRLGFHRAAPVVLAQVPDDPGRDRR